MWQNHLTHYQHYDSEIIINVDDKSNEDVCHSHLQQFYFV